MRLDLVSFRGTALASAGTSLLSEWRVGTILQAVAIRDAKTGNLWLELGGQRHPARVASGDLDGPADGERLQVRVLRTHPVLALETLETKASSGDQGKVTAEALLRFVPKQESPTMMLANLAWLAQGKSGASTLPRNIVDAAMQLWRSLPDAQALTDPKTLQSTLNRSGAFLEANLAASQPSGRGANLAQDLKALMLSLSKALAEHGAKPSAARAETAGSAGVPNARGPLTSLPQAPATFSLLDSATQQMNELSRQTEGAIARLTTLQLANNAAEPSTQNLLIELPVRHDDRASVLRLRIEEDASRRNQQGAGSAWSVEAALDLGVAGALHARVTLTDHRVGVQLRAESPAIVEALSSRAPELESILREAGLEVDRVVCLHGMPAGDLGARPARLLDVRA
jgi:hypothetical protein